MRVYEFQDMDGAREFLTDLEARFEAAFRICQSVTVDFAGGARMIEGPEGVDMIYTGADKFTINFSLPAAMNGTMPERTDLGPLEE